MKQLCSVLLSALALNACAQLSGTYTVGGVSPDFPSVSSAVNAIVGGVASPQRTSAADRTTRWNIPRT